MTDDHTTDTLQNDMAPDDRREKTSQDGSHSGAPSTTTVHRTAVLVQSWENLRDALHAIGFQLLFEDVAKDKGSKATTKRK